MQASHHPPPPLSPRRRRAAAPLPPLPPPPAPSGPGDKLRACTDIFIQVSTLSDRDTISSLACSRAVEVRSARENNNRERARSAARAATGPSIVAAGLLLVVKLERMEEGRRNYAHHRDPACVGAVGRRARCQQLAHNLRRSATGTPRPLVYARISSGTLTEVDEYLLRGGAHAAAAHVANGRGVSKRHKARPRKICQRAATPRGGPYVPVRCGADPTGRSARAVSCCVWSK